jgi:hypothetical protein
VGIVSRFSVFFLSELADGHYIGKTSISLALANHVDNMVTKFKHHMRLNFLNLVSTLCIEKKHSLLQMRHQASCEPVNQSPCASCSSLSFLHWHLLVCPIFILHRLLMGEGLVENDKKKEK